MEPNTHLRVLSLNVFFSCTLMYRIMNHRGLIIALGRWAVSSLHIEGYLGVAGEAEALLQSRLNKRVCSIVIVVLQAYCYVPLDSDDISSSSKWISYKSPNSLKSQFRWSVDKIFTRKRQSIILGIICDKSILFDSPNNNKRVIWFIKAL